MKIAFVRNKYKVWRLLGIDCHFTWCRYCVTLVVPSCFRSYKEESADETDTDDIIESTAVIEEDDGTEMIEKVLCHCNGKKGSK